MPESVSVAMVTKIVEELKPPVIAFVARDFTDAIIAAGPPLESRSLRRSV